MSLTCIKSMGQLGFPKKIITIKIYNDSTLVDENICFSKAVKLVRISDARKIEKFKNYDAYVVNNSELEFLEIDLLNFKIPMKYINQRFLNEFVFEISIYLNCDGQTNLFSIDYWKGALYRDANYASAFYRIALRFPSLLYSENEKKFISGANTRSFIADMVNNNLSFFLGD